ncbi:MAG: Hsp20/alpha crystallin family protein [Rhodoferax sp.]|jgi:HSP20 family protein|uniref:Hsp20/alpha crystallin family protein n=1 Tax=Rhodoferax sp. TaxID=50421 RepID=UPI001B523979|nr:Hsp20/alpha crystallin family protein [Rhodoferax sp.]MBP8286987.1 Hsp20/alpha crystallin family protein [Rhodoferax sp.]MBP9147391.1 Hsp20/alpha crystallin family protein [Rhodoferax sp.]MBP9736861.1 Hsp20/alpha crystallin family protein [Rhodoferax sp.]
MYRSYTSGDLLSELSRLQRQFQRYSNSSSSIRGFGRSEFPAINIGGTPESVEIYAFAPGLDPTTIDVTVERGVLTLSGERKSPLKSDSKTEAVHINERFFGKFRRAVSLSDDVDPSQVSAKYSDGILSISVKRRESAQRRQIDIH